MVQMIIEFKMNSTTVEKSTSSDKSELYLFIIVVKLTLLFVFKVIRLGINLYKEHNKKVIAKHEKTFKNFNKSAAASEQIIQV